jgi:tetratricopeptide (TPR) repeat protein
VGNNLARVRRDRGWKKSQLLRALRTAAARRKVTLPGDASLNRRIAVWENQDGAVSGRYRDLLCDVYGMSAVELGIANEPEPASTAEEAGAELLTLTRLDSGLVQVLGGHTQSLRLMDRRFGGAAVYAQTAAHVEMIEDLIRNSVPGAVREAAAHQLSQAAALAGWQALDMGKVADAWRLHEVATAAGREARDRSGFSYARAQQAYVLIDAGRLDDARELIGAGRGTAGTRVPPVLQAWLHAAEGEALAALGRRDDALRALDAAADVIPDQPDDDSLPYVMLDAGHLAR